MLIAVIWEQFARKTFFSKSFLIQRRNFLIQSKFEKLIMMDCQYVATQRGGVALVFEGHRYNKVRDGKDGTVYWRCSRDRQCPGRAVTVHSRIKKANNKHNHNPDGCVKNGQTLLSAAQLHQLSALNQLSSNGSNGNISCHNVNNGVNGSLHNGNNCNGLSVGAHQQQFVSNSLPHSPLSPLGNGSIAAMAALLAQSNGNTAAAVAAFLQHQAAAQQAQAQLALQSAAAQCSSPNSVNSLLLSNGTTNTSHNNNGNGCNTTLPCNINNNNTNHNTGTNMANNNLSGMNNSCQQQATAAAAAVAIHSLLGSGLVCSPLLDVSIGSIPMSGTVAAGAMTPSTTCTGGGGSSSASSSPFHLDSSQNNSFSEKLSRSTSNNHSPVLQQQQQQHQQQHQQSATAQLSGTAVGSGTGGQAGVRCGSPARVNTPLRGNTFTGLSSMPELLNLTLGLVGNDPSSPPTSALSSLLATQMETNQSNAMDTGGHDTLSLQSALSGKLQDMLGLPGLLGETFKYITGNSQMASALANSMLNQLSSRTSSVDSNTVLKGNPF